MSWYKYDHQPMSNTDKIKFYSACVAIGVISSFAVALAPFFYSPEYLYQKTKEDAFKALKTLNSPLHKYTTEYSLVDIRELGDNCFFIISASKFNNSIGYTITDSCNVNKE